jgi:hypothetical protein
MFLTKIDKLLLVAEQAEKKSSFFGGIESI